eukprot:602945-Prymnesium_polylepis.1
MFERIGEYPEWNFQGADVGSSASSSAAACRRDCRQQQHCLAFTLVTSPAFNGKRCWLKGNGFALFASRSRGTISGVVRPLSRRAGETQHLSCFVLSLATAGARWQRVGQHIQQYAGASCSSLTRVITPAVQSPEFDDVEKFAIRHLHPFKASVLSRSLGVNRTFEMQARCGWKRPALILEDDAILHPDFDKVLQWSWRERPPASCILQLGHEGSTCESSSAAAPSSWWRTGIGWAEVAIVFTAEGAGLWQQRWSEGWLGHTGHVPCADASNM